MLHSYDNGARMDEPPLATPGRLRKLDAYGETEPTSPFVGALDCRGYAVTGRELL
jgi:hypothetical protein